MLYLLIHYFVQIKIQIKLQLFTQLQDHMQEEHDFHFSRNIKSITIDPMVNIFKMIRENNSKEGDYVKIIDVDTEMQPVYKITSLMLPTVRQDNSSNRQSGSVVDFEPGNKNVAQNKLVNDNLQKYKLSFGSQIFLKNTRLNNAKVEIIRPYFSNLYVQLYLKDKGFVCCKDKIVRFQDNLQTQGIWICALAKQQKITSKLSNNNPKIRFCNLIDNSYLNLDQDLTFSCCQEEVSPTFELTRIGKSNSYLLIGCNNIGKLIDNKSKTQIKRIIDLNIQRKEAINKRQLQIEIQIIPVEDSMITIHMQLNYARKTLQSHPSLRLIKIILSELIYYDISEFVRDNSLLSEYLHKLLHDHKILLQIADFLNYWYPQFKRQFENSEEILQRMSEEENLQHKNNKTENHQLIPIFNILTMINLLCRKNVLISETFLPFLDQLIINDAFTLASILLKNNQFFISQFHKAHWYSHLYGCISQSNKKNLAKYINFIELFCESEACYPITSSDFLYKQLPSTNNQYLIFHSIRNSDNKPKIFQNQLYAEGLYMFVHNIKSGKDNEFNTFMEGTGSKFTSKSLQKRQSLSEIIPADQEDVEMIFAQLSLISSLCKNYNVNIIHHYWPIVFALAPYCFRSNFPNTSNYHLKKIILGLVTEMGNKSKESILLNRSLIIFPQLEGQSFNRNSIQQMNEISKQNSVFFKQQRKKNQIQRKLLREMGQFFLKKCKEWQQQIKKKSLQAKQLLQHQSQNNLSEWLQIMISNLTLRLLKVKQKKEGLLFGYIKKLFQNVQKQKKDSNESDGNLITYFLDLLLHLLSVSPKYDRYLQQFKVQKNYQAKITDKITQVISTFKNKKKVLFPTKNKGLTKNELICGFSKESSSEPLLKRTNDNEDDEFLNIKMRIAKLLQLIFLNINEQMIDESVETLSYLVKNPNNISNLSSFSLIQMVHKYPFQDEIKRQVLQQWYLTSNCHLFNQFTTVLRLIYQKKCMFRRNANDILLIDNSNLLLPYYHLIYPSKYLNRMSQSCQSWLRPTLIQKYPQIYDETLKNLQISVECLEKLKSNVENQQFLKIIENLDLISSISKIIYYISDYYLALQTMRRSRQSKTQVIKNNNTFVSNKLNPISDLMLQILEFYIFGSTDDFSRRIKIIIHSLGNILSSVQYFSSLLAKVYRSCVQTSKEQVLDVLKLTSSEMILSALLNMPSSFEYFNLYLYLDGQQIIRQSHQLYYIIKNKLKTNEENIFIHSFSKSCLPKNNQQYQVELNYSQKGYEYMHQIIFMKIAIKLIYNNGQKMQFINWFKTIFKYILSKQTQNSKQKYYKYNMCSLQILRKRLFCQLAHYFIKKQSNTQISSRSITSEESVENSQDQNKSKIIDFILEQIMFCKNIANQQTKDKSSNISQTYLIQLYEYLIGDLIALACQLQVLSIGEMKDHLGHCINRLKQLYIKTGSDKNTSIVSMFPIVQQIIYSSNIQPDSLHPRKIPFEKIRIPNQSSVTIKKKKNSKSLKKWLKAISELNKEQFLNKNSDLVEDMIYFDDIYEFNSGNQDINLVINHNDLMFKLIETSLNMKRLKLNLQNQIFILEQLYCLAQSKSKQIHFDEQFISFGLRLFDHLIENESVDALATIEIQNPFQLPYWKTNTYCLGLQLQIIRMSRVFQLHPNRQLYYQLIIKLFQMATRNYQSDVTFLQLYFSSLPAPEEKNMFEFIIPFDSLLFLIINQIDFQNCSNEHYRIFAETIVKSYLILGEEKQNQFQKYRKTDILSLVQNMNRNVTSNIYNKLSKNVFYQIMLNMKK